MKNYTINYRVRDEQETSDFSETIQADNYREAVKKGRINAKTHLAIFAGCYLSDEQPDPPVDVIFRKYRKDGDIIALFPAIPATMGDCLSYQHIGQHGACDSNHVFFVTYEATAEEYADLYKELTEQVGYTLRVVKRTTAKHRRQRSEAVKAAVK